jgi:hypothetical protein
MALPKRAGIAIFGNAMATSLPKIEDGINSQVRTIYPALFLCLILTWYVLR